MAGADGSVLITTGIDTSPYLAGLQSMESAMQSTLAAIQGHAQTTAHAIEDSSNKVLDKLKLVAEAIGLGLGAHKLSDIAGTMTDLNSRAKIAAKGTMEVSDIMERLHGIADRAYSPLQATADAFMNNSFALNDLGYSMEKQLDIVDALTNALVASGAKGEQLERVMKTVSNSISMGKMNVRQLDVVLRSAGVAAEGMANYLGVSLARLKQMAREGKLTSKIIVEALSANMEDWRDITDAMPATIYDATTRLKNQLSMTVDEINKSTEIEQFFVHGIDAIKDQIAGLGISADQAIHSVLKLNEETGKFEVTVPVLGRAFEALNNNLDSLSSAIPLVVTGLIAMKVAKTGFVQAAQTGIGTTAKATAGLVSQTRALSGTVGAWTAFKVSLSGIDKQFSGGMSLAQVLRMRLIGPTETVIRDLGIRRAQIDTEIKALQTRLNRWTAVAAGYRTKLAQQASGTYTGSMTSAQLTAKEAYATNQAAIAHQNLNRAISQGAAITAQHNTLIAQSTVQQTLATKAAAEAAVVQARATYQTATANVAAAATGQAKIAAESAQAVAAVELIAAERALTAATNAHTLALGRQSAAALIASKVLAGLGTVVKGISAFFGGPLGLALTAAAIGTVYFMTKESEADKVTRIYGDSLDKLIAKYNLVEESAEGAATAIESVTLTQKRDQVAEAQENLDTYSKIVREKFKSLRLELEGQKNNVWIKSALTQDVIDAALFDLEKMEQALETQEGDLIQMYTDFDTKFGVDLRKALGKKFGILGEDFYKDIHDTLMLKHKDNPAALFAVRTAIEQVRQLNGELDKLEAQKLIKKKTPFEILSDSERSGLDLQVKRLQDAGIDINSIDFVEFVSQVSSLNSAEKSFRESLEKQINDVQEYARKLREAFEFETKDLSDTQKLSESYKKKEAFVIAQEERINDFVLMLRQELAEGSLQIEAKFLADIKVMEAEKNKGKKLTAKEELALRKEVVAYYIMTQHEMEVATDKANIAVLQSIRDMTQKAINLFAAMEAAAIAAGAAVQAAQYSFAGAQAQANLDALDKTIAGKLAEIEAKRKAAQALIDNIGAGLTAGSGGGGGGKEEDKAKKINEALREIELTLARMEGKTLKVIELEAEEELIQFNELLKEAGLRGNEAAEAIDRFKAAQEREIQTAKLEAEIQFLTEIGEEAPGATMRLMELKLELNDLNAELMKAAGYSDEFVSAWKRVQDRAADTTAWGSAKKSIREYIDSLSLAKAAQRAAETSARAIGDCLADIVTGAASAKDAMNNMCNVIISALMRMAAEAFVVKPIMEGLMAVMNGIGGFFGFGGGGGGGLPNGGMVSMTQPRLHSGGIVGTDSSGTSQVSPLAFVGAPRYHSGGLLGLRSGEIPIIAQRGEMVLTSSDQRALLEMLRGRGGSGGVNVQIITNTQNPVETETSASQDPYGNMNIQVLVNEVDKSLAGKASKREGALYNALKTNFNVNDSSIIYRQGAG